MPCFALKIEKEDTALNWAAKTAERLSKPDILRNPFIGYFRIYLKKDETYFIIKMEPAYIPKFGVIGIVIFLMSLLAGYYLFWPFYILTVGLAMAAFIQSKYFFYLVSWAGLRKAGYLKRPALLTDREFIKLLLED